MILINLSLFVPTAMLVSSGLEQLAKISVVKINLQFSCNIRNNQEHNNMNETLMIFTEQLHRTSDDDLGSELTE